MPDQPTGRLDRVTAQHVKNKWFNNSRWFHRGYVETEVDEFLDQVEETLTVDARMKSELLGICRRVAAGEDVSSWDRGQRELARKLLTILEPPRTPVLPVPADRPRLQAVGS